MGYLFLSGVISSARFCGDLGAERSRGGLVVEPPTLHPLPSLQLPLEVQWQVILLTCSIGGLTFIVRERTLLLCR